MTAIPLIDLTRWFEGDDADRRRLATDVDDHLRRLGFLLVVGHGVADEVTVTCRQMAAEFFHLSAARKAAVAMVPGGPYRGWVGPGLESNAASYGIETPPDLKETFAYGPVDVVDESLRERQPRWFATNRWPAEPPGFRRAAEAWWRSARRLADELLGLFAMALDLPPDRLTADATATTANVSLNWYGPRGSTSPEPNQFRIGPHTDFGTLTILDRQPGAGGLQVLDEAGDWIDAPWVPGSLLVNTGDLLRRWTNDRWCSNEHRVLAPPASAPNEELISLVFFHEPDHDALVEALPSCVVEGAAPRHPPVRADQYLASKMDALAVG